MYADSKDTLKNILEWLEKANDTGWEDEIDLAEGCRSDMERMARPDYHRGRARGMTQGPQRDPNAPRLNRAIPHVHAMLAAMRSRNRAAALEHARLALAVL